MNLNTNGRVYDFEHYEARARKMRADWLRAFFSRKSR